MYVDKRLRGVNAVQTLSRLNRICAPYDKKTFVLDFKNEYEDIQASFAPFYTETILNETITPSDIRTVEAQVDQYNFLDIDDIEEFNGYLYQDKRTSKEKARMWALLDKSLQIINHHPELEKLEIRATIKRFLRFYSFLIQATCFESVDLHKKYNFLSYPVSYTHLDVYKRQAKKWDWSGPLPTRSVVLIPRINIRTLLSPWSSSAGLSVLWRLLKMQL